MKSDIRIDFSILADNIPQAKQMQERLIAIAKKYDRGCSVVDNWAELFHVLKSETGRISLKASNISEEEKS